MKMKDNRSTRILGVGTDIITISRVMDAVDTAGQPFLDKAFTSYERKYAGTCPDPGKYYAITFASKEAIFKCFAIDWETGVQLTDIEIRQGKSGEPKPRLQGKLGRLAVERRVSKILLSNSHDGDYVIAVAILV